MEIYLNLNHFWLWRRATTFTRCQTY